MKKRVEFVLLILIIISLVSPLINASNQGMIIVNVVEGVGGDCILEFVEGWNLFSFCKNLKNNNILEVLSPIKDKYRYIMQWDLTTQSFEIYSPQASQNPFVILDDNMSFFIYMYEPVTLNVLGLDPSIENKDLIKGWNTPAYQYDFSTTIDNIFQGILSNLRYIMKWNAVNQEFEIYSPQSTSNPFNQINPKEGRFIYIKDIETINY